MENGWDLSLPAAKKPALLRAGFFAFWVKGDKRAEGEDGTRQAFWKAWNSRVEQSELVTDRPEDTARPRYPDFVFEADYRYLKGTASMDGGIDVWKEFEARCQVDAIM